MFKLFSILLLAVALPAAAAPAATGDEEFVGPFPSWRNLQTDYHAVGDGHADDTAAMQRALDDLTTHSNFCVLYIPSGTYRLTFTIKTVRHKHTDGMGMAVIGESPESTVLKWDGPTGGAVFQYDAWFSKISRLTIDGANRAQVGLQYGPAFSTYNETSDLIFRNVALGILFGGDKYAGQAENEVLRCRFFGCSDAGVKTADFNSMDIWVWYCRFEDCGHALFNGAGNFHAMENLFVRSKVADIGAANLMDFCFANNTSVGSARFLDFESFHVWGAPTTISGNRIIDPTDNFPLRLGNGGPYLVMDNVFKLPANSSNQAVKMTWGDQTFVGNTYTSTNAVKENGRFRRISEKVVSPSLEVPVGSDASRSGSAAPPLRLRPIIEVPAGADASVIQRALNQAAALRGQRPVVHLPMGRYPISQTLVIPAGSDVQLVGDSAGETGSRLDWTGRAGGLLLKLEGPARATLRDFYLGAPNARAMLVENADQPGGKIFADQLSVNGPMSLPAKVGEGDLPAALRVNGLAETDVELRCLQGSGNAGVWVESIGVQKEEGGVQKANQVSIFNGATGSAASQYTVRDGGRLVVRAIYHEISMRDCPSAVRLSDSGTLVVDATHFSCNTSAESPFVALKNFHGLLTLATSTLLPVDSPNTCRFEITGNGTDTSVLALGDLFWVNEPGMTAEKVWQNQAVPPARGGMLNCNINTPHKGFFKSGSFAYLDNLVSPASAAPATNTLSDAEVLADLAPLREARIWLPGTTPETATDLRIYRVMMSGGGEAVAEFSGR